MDITSSRKPSLRKRANSSCKPSSCCSALDVDAPATEQLNAIFRAAHSIKGGAATFGFNALAETTHLLESLLDRARHGRLRLSEAVINAFLKTKDALQEQLEAYREGEEPDAGGVASICSALRALVAEADGAAPAGAGAVSAHEAVAHVLNVAFVRLRDKEGELLLEEMGNLGKVLASKVDGDGLAVRLETSCSPDDIAAVCCFLIDESQIAISSPAATLVSADAQAAAAVAAPTVAGEQAAGVAAPQAVKESSSIRVDVEKVDKLINLVGELVITQSMLTEAASLLDPVLYERLLSGLGHLERNAGDLQESVMSIRMMPVDSVFSRYPRLIRDVSAKLGKQVRLETYGEETELDKGLIQRIVDPLTHLVRNSLDHGIETPAQRLAKGKDATGRLLLSAQHHGGNIVIEVSDDGAGLNRERILAKAMQQGLPVSETTSDEEVWQLIFAPGFSTAAEVTDISGRGVGMDVVKRNIHEMGGHVEISSRAGQGTTTRIVLPLDAGDPQRHVGAGGQGDLCPAPELCRRVAAARCRAPALDHRGEACDPRTGRVSSPDRAAPGLWRPGCQNRPSAGHPGDCSSWRRPLCPVRGRTAWTAPGGRQEPRDQLPQGAGYFGSHHPGRRQRGADHRCRRHAARTERACAERGGPGDRCQKERCVFLSLRSHQRDVMAFKFFRRSNQNTAEGAAHTAILDAWPDTQAEISLPDLAPQGASGYVTYTWLLDPKKHIIGYRMGWRPAGNQPPGSAAEQLQALVSTIAESFVHRQHGWCMGKAALLFDVTPDTLSLAQWQGIPAQNVVLCWQREHLVDPNQLPVLQSLREEGFGIMLCGASEAPEDMAVRELVTHFDVGSGDPLLMATGRSLARRPAHPVCHAHGPLARIRCLRRAPRAGSGEPVPAESGTEGAAPATEARVGAHGAPPADAAAK